MKSIYFVFSALLIIASPSNSQSTEPIPETNCQCVPKQRCSSETIDNNTMIDVRLGGVCEHYLQVCCDPAEVIPENSTTPIAVPSEPVKRKGCGVRNVDGISFRILGNNNEAQMGEFPWMVAILNLERNLFVCGGALIHPQVVLTAAHCLRSKQPSTLKVRAGEWDAKTEDEMYSHQDVLIDSFVIHERFNRISGANDFGLIRLSQPVEITENVDVVCLPDSNMTLSSNAYCIATGWGQNAFGEGGKYQAILKKVLLPIVSRDDCQSRLQTTRLGRRFKLNQSFICAGGEPGVDTCRGDGGGPLVCPVPETENRFYQAGIVSWGIGCGENRIPGVYADVAFGRDWIDEKMANWGFDTSEYVIE